MDNSWFEYNDHEQYIEYYDWYDTSDEEEYQEEITEPPYIILLKVWFLGSILFDLGEWDFFPDVD